MTTTTAATGKSRMWLWVTAEAAALAAAIAAAIFLDLGLIGAVLIVALVAVFTVMIVRSGEQRAQSLGNFSPAMSRYNRRMLAASAVYVVGLFGATSIVAVDGIAFTQMGQPDANAQEMAALLDRIMESAGARAIAVVGALSFLLGMLVLAYGLWRTRVVSSWVAPGVAIAAIALFLGQVTDNRVIFAIAFALYLVTFALLGWTTLRQSDDEWAGEPSPTAVPPAQPAAG